MSEYPPPRPFRRSASVEPKPADDTKPLPSLIEPWVNFFHMIGLPWFIIFIALYWVYPTASKSLETLNRMNEHAEKAIPLLEQAAHAVPLLEQLNRSTIQSTRQRHADVEDLKASIPQINSN